MWPEWNRIRELAEQNGRWELGAARIVASIAIPIAVSFYSHRLALIVAVPFGLALYWYSRRALRRFLKRQA
ncbi:MAG: hypothetical protein DMF86_23520 [Acidobacteria bacterium]|nr:MAG: hypothetical protein DMF86_23520 [Acidobacteriota bacterium]